MLSCEAEYDATVGATYINITMKLTRGTDSTPTSGKLGLVTKIYDDTGALICEEKNSSPTVYKGDTVVWFFDVALPRNYTSSYYTVSFSESY